MSRWFQPWSLRNNSLLTTNNPPLRGIFGGLEVSDKKKIIEARKKYLITQYQEYENRVKTNIPELFIGLEIDIRVVNTLGLDSLEKVLQSN